MDDSYTRKLEVWPGWALAMVHEPQIEVLGGHGEGVAPAGEFADRLYASEALMPWRPPPRTVEGAEPYTLQWFLEIENQRHSRHGRWIPRLLEFAKHSGDTLLGLGSGLGTDWIQYARHGAHVVVCTPVAEQLALIRRNFELRGLCGRFLTAPPTRLPLDSSSIDVACVSGLLAEVGEPGLVLDEVYRVLKPGGKVLAVAPARYDVDYWSGLVFPWRMWLQRRSGESASRRFSRRGLIRLFSRFGDHRVYKRQLRRSEVPHLWRLLPLPLLERLLGRVLVLKAFKPLSAAISVHLAA
jgi:ubiquinone/menaquinone biosynthesis C-methylase UbiE